MPAAAGAAVCVCAWVAATPAVSAASSAVSAASSAVLAAFSAVAAAIVAWIEVIRPDTALIICNDFGPPSLPSRRSASAG